MSSAGVGHSCSTCPERAAAEAADNALAALGTTATAALLFAAGPAARSTALREVARRIGTPCLVGATGAAVLGAGRADEGDGLVVLALAGITAEAVLLDDLQGKEAAVGPELADAFGSPGVASDLLILLPDATSLDVRTLVASVVAACAPAKIVGAGAMHADPVATRVSQSGETASGALAALRLRGPTPSRVGVTLSCRPVSPAFMVTRAEGNWVFELDGRPALAAYREATRGPLGADLRRAAQFVLAALPRGDTGFTPGSYLVRHLVGFDEARMAIALPEPVPRGRQIGFVLRDAASAREELAEMLEGLSGRRPAAGLYFDCCARGADLFGVSGLEAGYLERALPGVPFAGMLGACEIGPIGPATELLTYTGILALLD